MTPNAVARSKQPSNREAILIGQILAGRKDLYGDLLQPHLRPLSNVVRANLGNDPDLDDVIQQSVVKAFTHLEQFRLEASFRTWLTRIALNEALQLRRKRSDSRFLRLDHLAMAELIVDRTESPLERFERRETDGLCHWALAKLPEKYQIIIRLRDLERRSVVETARLLGMNAQAVKSRHRRARLRMANVLAPRLRSGRPVC